MLLNDGFIPCGSRIMQRGFAICHPRLAPFIFEVAGWILRVDVRSVCDQHPHGYMKGLRPMGIVAIVRVASKGGSSATRVMQHSVMDLVASGKGFEEQVRLAAVGHQIQVGLPIVEVELGRTRESVLCGLACRGVGFVVFWFFGPGFFSLG